MMHQPFHIVDQSPWPILASMNMLSLVLSITYLMKTNSLLLLLLSFLSMTMISFQWWRDMVRESTLQGCHTIQVTKNLKVGMLLFIISEIMFFSSFFWTFFHSSLSPNIEIGSSWPPVNITPFNPSLIPLLNTTILISSGISLTWAHHSLMNSNYSQTINALSLTILLGLYFTILQWWEYKEAPFTMADSIYGSTFFVATGFHGLHVLIGTSFLLIILIRTTLIQLSPSHHFGFEAAAWYWHFVDIVWLFLYTSIYWWGN